MSKEELKIVDMAELPDEEKMQRTIEIKAKMFDLMVQRDAFNQQAAQQMKMLGSQLEQLEIKED